MYSCIHAFVYTTTATTTTTTTIASSTSTTSNLVSLENDLRDNTKLAAYERQRMTF